MQSKACKDPDWSFQTPDFSYPLLEASSAGGCPTCRSILAIMPDELKNPHSQTRLCWISSSLLASVETQGHKSYIFDLQLNISEKDSYIGHTELRDIHPELDIFTMRNTSAGSYDRPLERSVSIIREWLQQCTTEHTMCHSASDFSPRRTLCLQKNGTAYVSDHGDDRTVVRYACLSHRWSEQTKAASIMAKTMAMYTNPFNIQQLPQLFQDAIAVTLALGIEHIWIDCLCIIQDDPEDWEKEASAMASIYENATFTIAATSCNGCEDTLFQQRPLPASTQITTWKGDPVTLRPQIPHPWTIRKDQGYVRNLDSTQEGDDFPLLSRGWVFQEHLLSRRYIHFGKNELLFECGECVWCECQSRLAYNRHSLSLYPPSQRHQDWPEIVQTYQDHKFTYPTDRLPALAGVAKRYHRLLGGSYISGHWFERMNETLGWYCMDMDDVGKTERQKTGGLPTWSWMSTGRNVAWIGSGTGDIEFLAFSQDQRGDPYMTAESATITLRGPLVKATVHHGSDWRALADDRHEEWPASLTFGVQITDSDVVFSIYPDYDFGGDTTSSNVAIAPVLSGSAVMLLLFAPCLGINLNGNGTINEPAGIVLRQVDGGGGGVDNRYERIGFYNYRYTMNSENCDYDHNLRCMSTIQTITLV